MRLSFIAAATAAALLSAPSIACAEPLGAAVAVPVNAGNTANALRLSAPHPIPTQVASQPGAVRIDGCFSDSRGSEGLTLVHHAVRITNTGDRAITGVRVRFAFYDAFGDVSATRTNIAEARIDPVSWWTAST